MTAEYKAEKLASVTDLQGGGLWEINILTFLAPVAVFVWAVLQTRQGFFKQYGVTQYFADFVLQCCTILLSTTVYADSPQTLMGLLLLPAVATYLQPRTDEQVAPKSEVRLDDNGKPIDDKDSTQDDEVDMDPLPVKPFITSYRGAMMIITCTSILAVDFKVFPRRFAKTENFGKSLMDLGVGSFVFAAGIVAARQQLKEQYAQVQKSFTTRMKNSLRHALPLFVLGMIRLATVKGLDYTEHVSEYGVHWNFFFTLALLSPAIALLQPILRFIPSIGLLAFILAIAYELVLFITPDMKSWLLLSPRIPGDFLSQNREGIFSFIGYLAIFLAGLGCGEGILPRDEEPSSETALAKAKKDLAAQKEKDSMDEDAEWLASVLGAPAPEAAKPKDITPREAIQTMRGLPNLAVFHLFKWAFLWSVFSVWAMWNYGPRLIVSRRMANLPYICWVCAFNCTQLLIFCLIEMLMFPDTYTSKDKVVEKKRIEVATSKVLKAFNRNGLALFLLANLLTGAVNLGMETWRMGDVGAVGVLVGYIGIIAGAGLILDHYDISIKL